MPRTGLVGSGSSTNEVTLPATHPEVVNVTDIVRRAIVDTGTCNDIISEKAARRCPDSMFKAAPIRLATANDKVSASEALCAMSLVFAIHLVPSTYLSRLLLLSRLA